MRAKHVRATLVRGHGGAHGSKETLARLATRQLADEALARCTHDDRESPCGETIETREQTERIPAPLAEAESRVEGDARALDAGGESHVDTSLELAQHLVQRMRSVCRSRVRRHVGNSAARVHEHDPHAGPRADFSHPCIEAKRRYVVHDASARSHGCLGNAALHRIDRDDCIGIQPNDALDHRHDAAGLHVLAHFCRPLPPGGPPPVARRGAASPRATILLPSAVRVSRSRSAAALVCRRSRFLLSTSFARSYAVVMTRFTSASTSRAVCSLTSRRCWISRPRNSFCSLSPTRMGPMASESPHCVT